MSRRTAASLLVSAVLATASLPAFAQQASLTVGCGIAQTCNATNTSWELSKALDSQTDTSATFTVTVTEGATTDANLSFSGTLTITNTGSAPANVGNILVNLQRKTGKNSWKTVATDIANSTLGDAATSAAICSPASSEGLGSFTETTGVSGALEFTDDDNTLFSIADPAFSLNPGESKTLKYVANFNNTALGFQAGELARAEAIVTFTNAGGRGGSGASCGNIDADGSSSVSTAERWVRSVPCRTTVATPVLEASNSSVTVTDTADGVTTTGTVTMTGFSTLFGDGTGVGTVSDSTSFFVDTSVDIGADGGSLTNRASLVAATAPACNTPVSLNDSATAYWVVEPPAPGSACTFTQGGWGQDVANGSNVASVRDANFSAIYGAAGVTVGGIKTMKFTSSAAVAAYLPAGGPSKALTANLVNPTSSTSGAFGSQVLALQLNADFSAAGATPAGLGDLVVTGLGGTYEGMTVAQILAAANTALGGGGGDIGELNSAASYINETYHCP